MKITKLSLLALAAGLCAAACNTNTSTVTNTALGNSNRTVTVNPTPAPAGAADELASARATFKETCSRCHKENGEGGIVELDEGEKPLKVPSLKEGHALKHSDTELARTIANGDDGMPAFKKRLTEQQINDLVRLIRHDIQGAAGANSSPSNANSGAHD
jgi:mono/diheme cytochrome c family protein